MYCTYTSCEVDLEECCCSCVCGYEDMEEILYCMARVENLEDDLIFNLMKKNNMI